MNDKGVIIDFDGTLADTLPDFTDSVNVGRKAFGLPEAPLSEVRSWVGDGMVEFCRRAVSNRSDISIEKLAAIIDEHYRQNCLNKTVLYPGMPALLDELTKRKIPLAILSNKQQGHTEVMADALFKRWPFVAVEGYTEESRRKPDPRTALEFVAKMQLTPERVLMVGDSGTDVTTAQNAGIIPVGVTWGYRSRQELIDTGANYIIDHPEELLALI